jgi:hypothetical protein
MIGADKRKSSAFDFGPTAGPKSDALCASETNEGKFIDILKKRFADGWKSEVRIGFAESGYRTGSDFMIWTSSWHRITFVLTGQSAGSRRYGILKSLRLEPMLLQSSAVLMQLTNFSEGLRIERRMELRKEQRKV